MRPRQLIVNGIFLILLGLVIWGQKQTIDRQRNVIQVYEVEKAEAYEGLLVGDDHACIMSCLRRDP